LNALPGEGVHIVTVNEYLAQRDADWMGPIYRFLGLTVGVIKNAQTPPEKRAAYACDITFGTNNELDSTIFATTSRSASKTGYNEALLTRWWTKSTPS